jgi:hypothetical protein
MTWSAAGAPGNVGVDAEAAGPGAGVVFLSNVREIDVADLVLVIERQQETPIANRNISWHAKASPKMRWNQTKITSSLCALNLRRNRWADNAAVIYIGRRRGRW